MLLLPLIIIEALVGVATGVFIQQTGRYHGPILIGVILLTAGNGLYIDLTATSSLGSILGFQIVAGLGAGLLFDPPLIALQALTLQDDIASATATSGIMRNVGVSLSILLGGVIFQNGMKLQQPALQHHGLSPDLLTKLSGADAATNINLMSTISNPTQKLAVQQAFAWSLRNFWIMCTCMAACGLLAAGFVIKIELAKEHSETQTGLCKKADVVPVVSEDPRGDSAHAVADGRGAIA